VSTDEWLEINPQGHFSQKTVCDSQIQLNRPDPEPRNPEPAAALHRSAPAGFHSPISPLSSQEPLSLWKYAPHAELRIDTALSDSQTNAPTVPRTSRGQIFRATERDVILKCDDMPTHSVLRSGT